MANDKVKAAKEILTKNTTKLKDDLKADKAKFKETETASSGILKTKVADLAKSTKAEVTKFDSTHTALVKSTDDKLAKEKTKKDAQLEKLKASYDKALEVPRGIIEEYKVFQTAADKNDNERHAKIVASHKAANKKLIADADKLEKSLNSAFEKETKAFEAEVAALDAKYDVDQKEQADLHKKTLSSIKSTLTKAEKAAESSREELTTEYDAQKTKLDKGIADAGTNKAIANPLRKELAALTKTYDANLKTISGQLAAAQVTFEKETNQANKENAQTVEELRVNHINDRTKLEREIKEKEIRFQTDLANNERSKVTFDTSTELALLSDENRIQLLLHKLTFEMQEAKILENYAAETAAFELNSKIAELDCEVSFIESKFTKAKSELEIKLKKKQVEAKNALEEQNLKFAHESKSLENKIILALKEATTNFEIAKKENAFKIEERIFEAEGGEMPNVRDLEAMSKSIEKNFEDEKARLELQSKNDLSALERDNTAKINAINSDLSTTEKEINSLLAQTERTRDLELKENENNRNLAQKEHDKFINNNEVAKLEKHKKYKNLIEQMQQAQNALSNELATLSAKEAKIRKDEQTEIASNESNYNKKIKENASTFESKRKSLIANR